MSSESRQYGKVQTRNSPARPPQESELLDEAVPEDGDAQLAAARRKAKELCADNDHHMQAEFNACG